MAQTHAYPIVEQHMKQRNNSIRKASFITISLYSTTLLVASLPPLAAQQNVLLIIADDLGADSLDLYAGSGSAPTPTIDSLAASGVTFNNAWANPTCTPTRAGIVTGRFGFRTGVGAVGDNLPLAEFTIPQALDSVGYATACIGKWHLGGNSNGGDDHPNLAGFDHYEGSTGGGVGDYLNWTKVTNGTASTVTNYATTETVDNALTWINNQGSTPWYVQLAFNAPHAPFHKPPNALHSYDHLSGTQAHINNNSILYYQAMVEAMDTEINRLLTSLPAATLANTNIIFVGDNGTPNRVSPGIVNGSKGSLYQGGVNVPLVISGPAVAAPLNRTNDSPIHTTDLFETVLELAGVDLAATLPSGVTIDSLSLVDYLSDSAHANYHSFSYTERFANPTATSDGVTISDADFKLIRFDSTGEEDFFHLSADADESDDLLDGPLTQTEQDAYDLLVAALDTLHNTGGGTTVVDSWDFEGGWGIWNRGGNDARRNASDSAFANSGTFCIRLRDDSSTSVMTTDTLDLSAYDSVTVDLSYIVNSFENTENFWLDISDDGGSSFTSVQSWVLNTDFSNNLREAGSATVNGPFTITSQLRFRCNASNNGDQVYIDDIVISGTQN